MPPTPGRDHAARQPVRYLGSVLAAQPRLARSMRASDALGLGGTDRYWALAAGGAVGFEEHLREMRYLDGADEWTAINDLARLARAVPLLDADLGVRIRTWSAEPGQDLQGRSRSGWTSLARHLDDPDRAHGLRSGANEVLRLFDPALRSDAAAGIHSHQARPLLVRASGDVPEALARLTHLLALSDNLGMRDIITCAAALRRVAASADTALAATGWSTVRELLSPRLVRLQVSLAEVATYRGRLASVDQAEGVELQARSIGDLLHPHAGEEGVRLAAESVDRLGPTVGAFTRAIERSSRNGSLLVPFDLAGRSANTGFWQPSLDPEAVPLRGIRVAAAGCFSEARLLPGIVSIVQQEHGLQLMRDHTAQLAAGAARTVDRVVAARTSSGDPRVRVTPPRRWSTYSASSPSRYAADRACRSS